MKLLLLAAWLALGGLPAESQAVSIDANLVFQVNGKPAFPIGFTRAPGPDSETPSHTDAYAELKSNGTIFHLTGPQPRQWGSEAEAQLDHILERSAKASLLVAISIPDLQEFKPGDEKAETELRRVVQKYKDHAGLGFWKSRDEPEWGKVPVPVVQRYYDIVHQIDRNHPVWVTQAPRGTIETLKPYNSAYDVGAIDIYPISYPPGLHTLLPNKNISMVGDYAQQLQKINEGKKPFWMVLQVCFSGVARPDRTLRFPTFPEERYMTYQSIINGARGLVYFGGNVKQCMNERDSALGWNWTFYQKVLKPVLDELNPRGPLFPALVAPKSHLPVTVSGADDVEFCVREAAGAVYLLAAKREGSTVQVTFKGLPASISSGDVLYEDPRKVKASDGSFTDWFGPNEVHVYRFAKGM